MKTLFRNMTSRLLALLAAITLAFAQGGAQAQSAHSYSQQELDQLLAPIALYPDALLSQVLMAATYPLEVVEAARWSRAHPGLSGDAAVRAAESEDWDPSVKSLVAFPQVLERMDENLQWTQALGDAFLDQQAQVMDTVQLLRRRAEAAGNLRSDDRLRVYDSGSGLMLEPLNPELVYVPYYDPLVVYGSWWWPAYPPFHWRPWTGYYARPGYARGYFWGPPVGISVGFFFGACDWPRRQVRVVHVNNYYYRHSVAVNRAVLANRAPGAWRHEPQHRRGIAYRGFEAQRRFGAASTPQGPGMRVAPADPRRAAQRSDLRPSVPPVTGAEARSDARRPDTRTGAETRRSDERIELRPAAPAAIRPEARPDGRRSDARSGAETRPQVQPAPATDIRIERRRPDARTGADTRPNPPPPVHTEIRIEGRPPDARSGAEARPRVRPAPAAHTEPRIEGRGRDARSESNARIEVPRAPRPRPEVRPAPSVARQETTSTGVTRHEPAPRRQEVPRASTPRADVRPPQATARQESRANSNSGDRSRATR